MSEIETTNDDTQITQRLLLTLREAAKIIGTKGSRVQKVRDDNDVTVGITERRARCSDRILICTGSVENVSNAIGDICKILLTEDDAEAAAANGGDSASIEVNGEETNGVDANGADEENARFAFPFLNFRLQKPTLEEVQNDASKLDDILNIRLLVTRAQCSAIIGTKGDRIKSYIERFGVKMLATNQYLPDSDERLLELQGYPNAISLLLTEINTLLLSEVQPSRRERLYTPHTQSPANVRPRGAGNSQRVYNEDFKATVMIPEDYVGAIVGRSGNRIANLRKFSKTRIIIEKRSDDAPVEGERTFEILGSTARSVQIAESLLKRNLEAEIERRAEITEE